MTPRNSHPSYDIATDKVISELLNKELPDVSENPWFTRRVMNRLPERSRWASGSIWQLICYALGAIAMLMGIWFSGYMVVDYGISFSSLTSLLTISFLLTICGAIFTIPSIIRILREP